MAAHDNIQPQQFGPAVSWGEPKAIMGYGGYPMVSTWGKAAEDTDDISPITANVVGTTGRWSVDVRRETNVGSEVFQDNMNDHHATQAYVNDFRTEYRAKTAAEGAVRRRMQGLDMKTGRKPNQPGNGKPY